MLKEEKISNITQPEFERPLIPVIGVRGDIVHRYGKFTDQETTVLNDKNDLVATVQPKYRLDRPRRKALSMRSRKGGS